MIQNSKGGEPFQNHSPVYISMQLKQSYKAPVQSPSEGELNWGCMAAVITFILDIKLARVSGSAASISETALQLLMGKAGMMVIIQQDHKLFPL